ncbi:hypothetical protein KAX22_09690 [bacterium]|nr:hypothetical protein [bacterium]
MKWSTVMTVAMWVGLVSLVMGILIRLRIFAPFPIGLWPRSYLQFTSTCFLFAILAGLCHLIREKGK